MWHPVGDADVLKEVCVSCSAVAFAWGLGAMFLRAFELLHHPIRIHSHLPLRQPEFAQLEDRSSLALVSLHTRFLFARQHSRSIIALQ